MTITEAKKELEDSQKIPVFEIEVLDEENETDYIIFDVRFNLDDDKIEAQHIALTEMEDKSDYISYVDVDYDSGFSLDENLQGLYEECINAILSSEFYKLK